MIKQMDNQQETSWFVGILEGEGSFMYDYHGGARISISNTDEDIIDTCESYLKKNYVFYSLYNNKRSNKRKREYEIRIQGVNNCNHVFKLISNKFECRRKECLQILGSSETTREISFTDDLYWLIGILEAEASFSIGCRYAKACTPNYQPDITIANTRFDIIQKIAITLHRLGLAWYSSTRVPSNPNHSIVKIITISGFKRVLRLLDLVNDLFVTRKTSLISNLMLEFCQSRFTQTRKEPYTGRQIEIYHTLRDIHS